MPAASQVLEKEYNYADTLWCTYIVSVVAASIAELTTYPLDLTKTRLQIQGELANKQDVKITTAPHRGMLKTAAGIVREEGLLMLWQGTSAALLRHTVYSGTRIVCYQTLREKVFLAERDKHFPLWKSALSGITAGSVAQFIASPTDLLKVHIQMEGKRRLMGEPPRVKGLYDAFLKVIQTSGVRGSIPNVQRAALVNLGDLTTYDSAKRFILRHSDLTDGPVVHVMSSACAGFVAAGMGTPADVVKTRVMNQPTDAHGNPLIYKSSWDCLKKTIANEGGFALYKGFLPVWIRMAPWSLIFWLSFEQTKTVLGASHF
ncbi:Uncoupling protein 4A [Carabus blaptoides fortunei]